MNIVNSYFTINPFGKSDECALFTIDDVSLPFTLSDISDINQEYTLSFWAKSESAGSITIGSESFHTSDEWVRYVATFKATYTSIKMFFGTEGSYFVYRPKLEIGNIATDWTPAPEDLETEVEGISIEVSKRITPDQMSDAIDQIDEFHNTAVHINADGILMDTTGSIRAVVDDVERLTIDEEGVSSPLIVADDIRSNSVVMTHRTSSAEWKGGIQKSIDAISKYLTQDTTLVVPAGSYSEDVVIRGFVGSTLTVKLSAGVKIEGTVTISNCSDVSLFSDSLGDSSIVPRTAGDYVIGIYNCQSVLLRGMYISGIRNRTSTGVGTSKGVDVVSSNVRVYYDCIEYTSSCAYYQDRGTFYIENVIGGGAGTDNENLGYSVRATKGAHGAIYGRCPLSVNGYGAQVATLVTSSPAPTAGGMEYVAPAEITKTFAISKHCTYLYGNKRIRDDQSTLFSQGRYGTYSVNTHYNDWRTGAMWFADVAEALSGKTIVNAKLTIRRASGGSSKAIDVYLGAVDLTEANYASTTTPVFVEASVYPIGKLSRETEVTYDVTELMPYIKSNKAIGVFEPRDEYSGSYSPEYTPFYGKGSAYEPVLTVTYK